MWLQAGCQSPERSDTNTIKKWVLSAFPGKETGLENGVFCESLQGITKPEGVMGTLKFTATADKSTGSLQPRQGLVTGSASKDLLVGLWGAV